jgi:hypothetical protein
MLELLAGRKTSHTKEALLANYSSITYMRDGMPITAAYRSALAN